MPWIIRATRCAALLVLLLAAACAAPPTATPVPASITPNGVLTALAQLTASFASLTPSPSEIPSQTLTPSPAPTASASATLAPSNTPSPTLTITPAPTSAISGTATLTATAGLSLTATLTPTVPPRIVAANAARLGQAALLAQAVLSGTPPARLDQVAWAPDGQLAAAGAAGVLFPQTDTLTAMGGLAATHGYTMGAWVPSLSFSTDNRALALSSVGNTARLFTRDNGDLLFQLVQPSLRVSQVRYRPGPPGVLNQYLATLGGDNTVFVWDVAYRKFLGILRPGPSSAEALEISGDGRWLAAASGRTVLLWDMNSLPAAGWSGAYTPTLALTQAGQVTGLALSPDGFVLAASNVAGLVELWTLPAGRVLGQFGLVNALPARLAFSPDSQLVAAAYDDLVIRVWGLGAIIGRKPNQPTAPLAALAGHSAAITSVAFSPDGRVLASSSWDGTVREWAVGE